MFDFHEKRKIRNILYSPPFIAFIFIVGLVMSRSVYERFLVEREMNTKLDEKVDQLLQLQQRAVTLESDVEHLKNERGIEEELRNRFDVVREGEQVVVILDDTDKKPTPIVSTTTKDVRDAKSEQVHSFWNIFKF